MKTDKLFIILFSVIVCVCIVITFVWMKTDGKTANIYVDGELYRKIDLSSVTQSYEIELEHNTLLVENGRISMVKADCPDKLCIKRGVMSGGTPIVCLPNKVTVIITSEEADAVSW